MNPESKQALQWGVIGLLLAIGVGLAATAYRLVKNIGHKPRRPDEEGWTPSALARELQQVYVDQTWFSADGAHRDEANAKALGISDTQFREVLIEWKRISNAESGGKTPRQLITDKMGWGSAGDDDLKQRVLDRMSQLGV